MDTKVTIQELYLHVAGPPGDEVIGELQRSLKWSVSEFKPSKRWKPEPLTDSTIMPKEGWHRKDLIDGTGISVEYVVVHEIDLHPVQLPEVSEEDVELVGKVFLVVAGVAVAICLAPLLLVGLVVACSSGDPQLLCKVTTREGKTKWLSCFRWY